MNQPKTTTASGNAIRPFRLGWLIGTFRPRLWALSWVTFACFYLLPLLTGWLLKLAFDALSTSGDINGLLIALGVAEVFRWVIFAAAIYFVVRWWISGLTLIRTNMLAAQTVSGGPHAARLPDSPAEAISRFSDDTRDCLIWTDSWLDGAGVIAYGVGALAIMSTIDARAAFVVLVPLTVVTVITRLLTPRLFAARSADRAATSRVNSFLGETFAGMLAFRLAGREEAAIARLERYTAVRRKTAVKDTVLQQTIEGISTSTTDVTIGLMLLMLVPAVRTGSFSVGDLALFVAYAADLGELPRYIARLITSREQAIVAFGRLGEMVAPGEADNACSHRSVTIEPHEERLSRDPDPPRVPLKVLDVQHLSAIHPSTAEGVRDVSFSVVRGSFTVITGIVGAGKSTLLRALVGLMPLDEGTISWNGTIIDDPAAWFVPPNAAHLSQQPRLFSESLRDNITLGRNPEAVGSVVKLTTLSRDLSEMPDGLDTMVGARGLRLSGGQAQRVAAARSLLTSPELLVVDDLSSALDVTTERELWEGLAATGITVIAVSQRQLAIDRADQIIRLEAGRIV